MFSVIEVNERGLEESLYLLDERREEAQIVPGRRIGAERNRSDDTGRRKGWPLMGRIVAIAN